MDHQDVLLAEKAIRVSYSIGSKEWTHTAALVLLSPEPFAKGTSRLAYKLRDLTRIGDESELVAKVSIQHDHREDVYLEALQQQTWARVWAQRFNDTGVPKKIDFLQVDVLQLVERAGKPTVNVEKFIPGTYKKWSNNWSYADPSRNTPHAFSHFTWVASNNELLICDLQGVNDLLTDPQFHTVNGVGFGKGNLGLLGIQTFLAHHACNDLCRFLNLPPCSHLSKPIGSGTQPTNVLQFEIENGAATMVWEPDEISAPPGPTTAIPASTGVPNNTPAKCAESASAPSTTPVKFSGIVSPTGSAASSSLSPQSRAPQVGIGVVIVPVAGRMVVSALISGGPAMSVGLKVGDVIDRVDGASVSNLPASKVIKRICGVEGSYVNLDLTRGIAKLKVNIQRRHIDQHPIDFKYQRLSDQSVTEATEYQSPVAEALSARTIEEGDWLMVGQGRKIGVVNIELIEARGLPPKCNAFVLLQMGQQSARTGTIPKSGSPVWRTRFSFDIYSNLPSSSTNSPGPTDDITIGIYHKSSSRKGESFLGSTVLAAALIPRDTRPFRAWLPLHSRSKQEKSFLFGPKRMSESKMCGELSIVVSWSQEKK